MSKTSSSPASAKPKAKPAWVASASAFELPKLEMSKFEIPTFDLPKVEVPEAYREFAEKSIGQIKDGYEKIKAAAEEANELLAESYATGSRGSCDYGLKVIDSARVNTNAAFDLLGELVTATSYSELAELCATYVREQFNTVTEQAQELANVAQKVATETVDPVKEGLANAFRKAA
jgi:phasin